MLKKVSLDFQNNKLTMEWDEAVKPSTLDAKQITVRSDQLATGVKVVLTDSKSKSVIGTTVVVDRTPTDVNNIKAAKLASSHSATFVELAVGAIKDVAVNSQNTANANQAVLTAKALQVLSAGYIKDATAPKISSFSVHLGKKKGA